jgi:hypothetical protein
MARNRERIERGLYRDGRIYYACATPPGSRTATWKSLGPVGLMEARRLRDEFVAEVRRGQPREPSERRRATFAEVADEWLAAQRSLVDVGELAASPDAVVSADAYETPGRRPVVSTRPRSAARSKVLGAPSRTGGQRNPSAIYLILYCWSRPGLGSARCRADRGAFRCTEAASGAARSR